MPLPASVKHITVTGTWFKGDGTPASGTVTFARGVYLQGPGDDAFIVPYIHTATLDVAGSISISLPATDDPDWSPQGWMYTVTEALDDVANRSYSLAVPFDTVGDTFDIADVLNIAAPTVPELYAPLGHTHEGGGGGAVDSVNGETGVVVLDAADVGAAPTVHTHTIANVTNLQTTLDGKAASAHTHAIADVTNLQTSLDGKAASAHTHAIADTTGLQTALDDKAATASIGSNGTNAALTSAASVQGWPSAGTMPRAYEILPGIVFLDGGIEGTGTNAAGTTLATLPVGFRPVGDRQFTMRHTVTSASTGTISVNASTGAITYNSGFNSGAIMDFTGVQFRKA